MPGGKELIGGFRTAMLKKTARMKGFGILFNPEIMTEGEVTYAEGMIAAGIIGVY